MRPTKPPVPKPAQTAEPLRRLGKQGQALASLNALFKSNLRRSADGRKGVSHATIADRSFFFSKMVRELRALGYPITDVHHLKPKHVAALMRRWEGEGRSASTLQKRFSYLNLLCRWIGKPGMLGPAASYLDDPAAYQRVTAATYDHSWTARGIDPLAKIAEIAQDDPAVARVLRLQYAFGLRIQEASLLNPARDGVDGQELRVVAGTKGGRPRTVPIETAAQRAVLAEAAQQAALTRRSMIPVEFDLKAWLAHVYRVLARHGVTRQDGLVSHGLRHQYANDRYEELTGEPSPVRGGDPLAAAHDRDARLDVTARLGHARMGVTTAYYGKAPPDATGVPIPPTAAERQRQAQELRVQQRLLMARLKAYIDRRHNRPGVIAASTLQLRWRLLHRMLADLAQAGVPLQTPEQLEAVHIDTLTRLWRESGRWSEASARNNLRLLIQLCGWLDRPELAWHARRAWSAANAAPRLRERPWSAAQIDAQIAAIRAVDARVALHVELVRVLGLTHVQAARLQPGLTDAAPYLEVLWETPRHQVLRLCLTTDRQRAVLAEAQRLLHAPQDAVCPAEMAVSTWLRKVYDLLRQVGGIGIPGAPTLHALKDPDVPTPILLDRETYLLNRAGLHPGNRR